MKAESPRPPVPSQSDQFAAAKARSLLPLQRRDMKTLVAHFWLHALASVIAAVVGYLAANRFNLSTPAVAAAVAVATWESVAWYKRRASRETVVWDRARAERQRWAAKPGEIAPHRERPMQPQERPIPVERTADEMRVNPPS